MINNYQQLFGSGRRAVFYARRTDHYIDIKNSIWYTGADKSGASAE